MIICKGCKETKQHSARGLCKKCYRRAYHQIYKDRIKIDKEIYRDEHPEKHKARIYAKKHNQKENECLFCDSRENLQFHHTDYENNKGYTLCIKHHGLEHKKINENKKSMELSNQISKELDEIMLGIEETEGLE